MLGPQTVWVDVTSLEDIFIVLYVCCVLHSIDKDSAMFQWIYSSILSFSSSEEKCLYTGTFTRIHTIHKKGKVQVVPLVVLSKKDSSCPAEHQPAAWWILMPKHNELWSFPVAEQDPGSSLALSAAAHSRWMPSIQSTLKEEMKCFSCFSLWLLPAFTQSLSVFMILVVVHRNVTYKSRYSWGWHVVT